MSFGLQSFILKVIVILCLLMLGVVFLTGCAKFSLVDRSENSTYSGANQTISEVSATTKSWDTILKDNALTLSLGALNLLLLYAYLNQRGTFKGLVKGVDRFKASGVDDATIDKLYTSLRADTTSRQRRTIKKFRKV